MQKQTHTNCIKISSTGKGEHHWEQFLMDKQRKRLDKLLTTELGIDPWVKRKVFYLFEKRVTRENIIPLTQHPIRIFLHHLIHDNLEYLIKNSTTQNF